MKNKRETLLIALYSGPGTGKSTTMAGVFAELKLNDINCEMSPEFAKEKVWEGSFDILKNQIYVFGKQYHTIQRLMGKVDVIITDSPLLLSLVYDDGSLPEFRHLVLSVHHRICSLNYFLKRNKKYNPSGRMQNEEEAIIKDEQIKDMLDKNYINYETIDAGRGAIKTIAERVLKELKENSVLKGEC